MSLGSDLGIRKFSSFPGLTNVQPGLRAMTRPNSTKEIELAPLFSKSANCRTQRIPSCKHGDLAAALCGWHFL